MKLTDQPKDLVKAVQEVLKTTTPPVEQAKLSDSLASRYQDMRPVNEQSSNNSNDARQRMSKQLDDLKKQSDEADSYLKAIENRLRKQGIEIPYDAKVGHYPHLFPKKSSQKSSQITEQPWYKQTPEEKAAIEQGMRKFRAAKANNPEPESFGLPIAPQKAPPSPPKKAATAAKGAQQKKATSIAQPPSSRVATVTPLDTNNNPIVAPSDHSTAAADIIQRRIEAERKAAAAAEKSPPSPAPQQAAAEKSPPSPAPQQPAKPRYSLNFAIPKDIKDQDKFLDNMKEKGVPDEVIGKLRRQIERIREKEKEMAAAKQPKAEPKTEPKAEPKAEPKTEPKAEPRAEPKAEPKTEPKAEPKAEPKTEPKAEPKAQPKMRHFDPFQGAESESGHGSQGQVPYYDKPYEPGMKPAGYTSDPGDRTKPQPAPEKGDEEDVVTKNVKKAASSISTLFGKKKPEPDRDMRSPMGEQTQELSQVKKPEPPTKEKEPSFFERIMQRKSDKIKEKMRAKEDEAAGIPPAGTSSKGKVNEASLHPMAVHVKPISSTHYEVVAVGRGLAHGLEVGEKLGDSHIDDLREINARIKYINPRNRNPNEENTAMDKTSLIVEKMMKKMLSGSSKDHTEPRTTRERHLAAMGHPKNKITHKDVLIGRGVLAKEEVEQINEAQYVTFANHDPKINDMFELGNRVKEIHRSIHDKFPEATSPHHAGWGSDRFTFTVKKKEDVPGIVAHVEKHFQHHPFVSSRASHGKGLDDTTLSTLRKDDTTLSTLRKEEVEQQWTNSLDEASYSAKAARAGEDIGKPGKMFGKIAASAAERYGSEEAGKRVAGSILKRLRAKK